MSILRFRTARFLLSNCRCRNCRAGFSPVITTTISSVIPGILVTEITSVFVAEIAVFSSVIAVSSLEPFSSSFEWATLSLVVTASSVVTVSSLEPFSSSFKRAILTAVLRAASLRVIISLRAASLRIVISLRTASLRIIISLWTASLTLSLRTAVSSAVLCILRTEHLNNIFLLR